MVMLFYLFDVLFDYMLLEFGICMLFKLIDFM